MSEGPVTSTVPLRRRGGSGITGAVILISLGVIFLLSNMGLLSISWFDLARYWPVLLVLAGIDILIGRSSFMGSVLTAVVAVAVIGGIVWLVNTGSAARATGASNTTVSYELGDVESLRVNLSMAVAGTKLTGAADDGMAATGSYNTDSDLKLISSYETEGNTGVLTIEQKGDNDGNVQGNVQSNLNLAISDAVPVDLIIDVGVGETTLDLSGLNIRSLSLNTGVGTVEVTLPGKGDYAVDINAGIGSIKVRVPDSLEVRANVDRGITGLDLPTRFEKEGDDRWETRDFNSASDRVTITVNSGIGNIEIIDR
jgi:hypothetical protein